MVQPIPKPEVLDPDRVTSNDRDEMTLSEHRSRAQQLDEALHASCSYANQLWDQLDATRSYLYESLPPDPRDPGGEARSGASPTGPDDEPGWRQWGDVYSATTSVLAGPHGDSGFGFHEARRAEQIRREAPNLRQSEELNKEHVSAPSEPTAASPAHRIEVPPSAADRRSDRLRYAGLAVLGVLALRGLRPNKSKGAKA